MALDPNNPTVGSWGLGPLSSPLGAASTSTMPLAAPSTLTPAQVALMRQHAMALQEPPQGGIHHWTQGLAELMRAIQGNREADFAREAETTGRKQGAEAIGQIYAPYLSQSGASAPAAGAAPAGTLGSGPAGADTSGTVTADASAPAADSSAPRGIRNNNPLNIEDGQFARSQPGYAGSDGRFAKFEAPEHGVQAASTLLDSYQKNHGLNTISGIVNRWAPASDHNNTSAYAAHVAAQMGIGPNDPIPPEMRPQLIAAMARHENGVPLPTVKGPSGLLAPIPPAGRMSLASETAPNTAALPPEITQGASPAPTVPQSAPAAPTPAALNAPMIDAIAGRPNSSAGAMPPGGVPWNPDDFKRQVAAMEAAKGTPIPPADENSIGGGPVRLPNAAPITPAEQAMMALVRLGAIPQTPDSFASQAAAMEATKPVVPQADESSIGGGPTLPSPPVTGPGGVPVSDSERAMMALVKPGQNGNLALNPSEQAMMALLNPSAAASPAVGPTVAPDALPPDQVPIPRPRPIVPPAFLTGGAIPGAVGPTSVGGAPLIDPASAALPPPIGPVSANGKQLPQGAGLPPATLVNAIAGRPVSTPAPAAMGGGASDGGPPAQVAQNGQPPGGAPMGAGGPPGLPHPLTSPTGNVTPQQLTQMLANPWVPESTKAAMLQMIQQRGQVQSLPMEGGTYQYDASGRHSWIPQTVYKEFESNGTKMQLEGTRAGPNEPMVWKPIIPGAGGPMHPGAPDYSTPAGRDAIAAASAGAKKAGEERAKSLSSIGTAISGDAFNAARQEGIIDAMQRIAPAAMTGAGTNEILALNRMASQMGLPGIGPDASSPAAARELFNQLSSKLLADQFANIRNMASEEGSPGGKIFKSLLDIEEKANITPEDSLPGVQAKLAFMRAAGDRLKRWGDMADDYKAAHNGQIDEGFLKAMRKDMAAQRFDDILPEADATSPTGMKSAPSAPVSKVINGKTYYQINGKVYDNPEGK